MALRVANLLVGNPEHAAVLEFTLVGPELRFAHDTVIALTGGQADDLPGWRPLAIRGGTTLKLGQLRSGCRGYLAVAGGIDVTPVLGSRSTYARAGLGGFAGRVLCDGDVLAVPTTDRKPVEHWRIDERILPPYSNSPVLRVVPAKETEEFHPGWTEGEFHVTPHADRMGVRLGGKALVRRTDRELISSPVVPGTVQVPPDGQPIVLLADAQTIGGYPQVATVVSVDLPLVAQLKPGDRVRFRRVTWDEAHRLLVARDHALALLGAGLREKWA
jgi:antagonist of KipI